MDAHILRPYSEDYIHIIFVLVMLGLHFILYVSK